jgi:spermidine/putrescine ABC transporter ATP-binding subunit
MIPTAHLNLINVTKKFGTFSAVNNLSFEVAQSERLALLGPSGCGKTTTLNMIAGFLPLDGGGILVKGKDISAVPANKRNMSMVFQNYALFPHLSVARNVAFGLEIRGIERKEIDRRVSDALALVQLNHVGDRFPRQLSGGQQQRVAVARALVIRPDILLLDEPLSNLDAKLRQSMRAELASLLKGIGITTIFVTHDQAEALVLADRVAVLNQGRIEQIGSPQAVYEQPETAFVAKFLGETNILPGKVVSSDGTDTICETSSGIRIRSARKGQLSVGTQVEILIRSERLLLSSSNVSTDPDQCAATIERIIYLGADIQYDVRVGMHHLIVAEKNGVRKERFVSGQNVMVGWQPSDVFVAPATNSLA